MEKYPIDFVVLYVDGSDPVWTAKRNQYLHREDEIADSYSEERSREFDAFRYWFRAVAKNAPWVHRIYVVTDDQTPEWLNTEHEKIIAVDHRDFIPPEYLPLFNSCAIEVNIHRIKGLSEHFVYFNDDMVLNSPVVPGDFFHSGLPLYYAGQRLMHPLKLTSFEYQKFTDMGIINRNFTEKQVRRCYRERLCRTEYGMKAMLRNVMFSTMHKFEKFEDEHCCTAMLKSTMEEVWEKEPQLLAETASSKFRSPLNVNSFLFRYWDIAAGRFVPRSKRARYYSLKTDSPAVWSKDIIKGVTPFICLNDDISSGEADRIKMKMQHAFRIRYPEKCEFEH